MNISFLILSTKVLNMLLYQLALNILYISMK